MLYITINYYNNDNIVGTVNPSAETPSQAPVTVQDKSVEPVPDPMVAI